MKADSSEQSSFIEDIKSKEHDRIAIKDNVLAAIYMDASNIPTDRAQRSLEK